LINGPWIGVGTMTLQGNTATPANRIISTSGNAVLVSNNGVLTVKGFKLTSSDAIGLAAQYGGTVSVTGKMEYGACAIAQIYVERLAAYRYQRTTRFQAQLRSTQALTYG
jgi:hypothetical protein